MKIHIELMTGMILSLMLLISCQDNEHGTVDLTLPETKTEYVYNHPCAMYNQADFVRVKTMLDNGTSPQAVKDEFQNLKNSQYAMTSYIPNPQSQIVRGDPAGTEGGTENYAFAMRDAAAAYQQALLWKLTGDNNYAATAIKILNGWAAVCKRVTSNDANHYLAAGVQGYTFANAGEILRDYAGWSAADFSKFKTWMVDVFAERNYAFLTKHSNTVNTHYWANWDLVNMASYLSIGILTEDDDMVSFVVNYFYHGVGNGCIERLIVATHNDPLSSGEIIGQSQESGRDQGHSSMLVAVAGNLCQMAYTLYLDNKEVLDLDFFAAKNNAILKMGEYTALWNLKNGTDNSNSAGSWMVSVSSMPFTKYERFYTSGNSTISEIHTQASEDQRGTIRPGWETIYNHYAKIKGLGSGYIYSKQFADKLRPEGGVSDSRYGSNSGAFDQLGWGTLMMYRD